MRPKKLETSVSRNILSILVRLSTETELHQNGHGRRWYEVRQISAICIQLDIFGESHFDLFSSFSTLRSFNFLLFLIEYSISFWHHCSTVRLHTVYIWIVLKSKVISLEVIFAYSGTLALHYISNMLLDRVLEKWKLFLRIWKSMGKVLRRSTGNLSLGSRKRWNFKDCL